MTTSTKSAKFTRRHLTAKIMTAALEAMTKAAGALAGGEKFELAGESGGYAHVKLSGCDTHGPVRCGYGSADDFAACRAALPALEAALGHFENLVISNQGRNFLLNFSGVKRWPSILENRD